MEILNAEQAKAKLLDWLEQINQEYRPREIMDNHGNAVLLSKVDWNSIQETLYLQAMPGLVQSVRVAEAEDDWISEAEFWEHLNGMDNQH